MILIQPVDHQHESVSQRIHIAQMLAYQQQEAKLLGAVSFPPLTSPNAWPTN